MMKNVKFNIIMMVFLLSPLCAAWGQSIVSEVQDTKADTSIVRHWTGGISIVYTHNKDKDNFFLLVDATVLQVRRIVVPSYVTVNDFRILHDSVFLCGHIMWGGNPYGLLACFAIQDFYIGSGNYHYGIMQQTDMPDCDHDPIFNPGHCQNMIYDITRMAVYDSSGFTKVAYTARNYVDSPISSRVGIGSACYRGSGVWKSWIIYNKDAEEEYTDIIATQEYVVAVGRTNDSARLAMRIFPKGNFLVPTWMPYPGATGAWAYYAGIYGQGMSDLEVDKSVMATELETDSFAVAYHYKNVSEEGLAIKKFSIVGGFAVMTQGLNVPVAHQPSSVWKMREVCYSTTLQRLALLNDIDCWAIGNQTSVVYLFQLPFLMSGTYIGKYLSGYDLFSLDTFGSLDDAFVTSGNVTGGYYLGLYWETIGPEYICGRPDVITGSKTLAPLYTRRMATSMNNPRILWGQTPFAVDEVEREEKCSQ